MTKAKFTKRMMAKAPESGVPLAMWLVEAVLLGGVPLAVWAFGGRWLAALLAVPGVYALGFWLFGRILLGTALLRWRSQGIRGVLVFSESPVWQPYIEKEWLPKFGDRFVTLNWSSRASWENSLAVLLWRHFCGSYKGGTGVYRNVNPAVIVLRGVRHPLVFRFHGPFEAAKHGEVEGLKALERRLLEAVGYPSSAEG